MFDRNQIKQVIEKLYPESKVFLFGSYARNEETKLSDIDVFVLFPDELEIYQKRLIQAKIRKELAKLYIAADVWVAGNQEY